MKDKLTYTLLLSLFIGQLFAQITEAEIKPDGIVVPRVDRTMTSGVEGQLIYDINTDSYWYHDGAVWIPVGNQSSQSIQIIDLDEDTSVEVERNPDNDQIILQVDGTDALTIKKNADGDIMFDADAISSSNNLYFGNFTGAGATGNDNTLVGHGIMVLASPGYGNVALGTSALSANTGNGNTAIGFQSLANNDGSSNNTGLGAATLQANITGTNNTAIGYQAGNQNVSGIDNTFLGHQAGMNNNTGMDNVMIGSQAGNLNKDGLSNVFIGRQAGEMNIDGESNVYIGFQAGQNAEALVNTMIGNKAGQMTTSGFSNVFLGSTAGNLNTTGEQNAYLGTGAGFFNGGSFNTFVGNGAGAGSLPLSSMGNVFIGYFAGAQETGDSLLYIDNSSTSTPLIWGNFKQGAKEVRVNGDFCYTGSLLACSDLRFKNNIHQIDNALTKLMSLQGIKHDWKHEEFEQYVWSKGSEYGVLAQEVETVFPELVSEDEQGYKYVNYTKFTPIFIEAIKAQQTQIEQLEKENSDLKKLLEKHENLLKEISDQLNITH